MPHCRSACPCLYLRHKDILQSLLQTFLQWQTLRPVRVCVGSFLSVPGCNQNNLFQTDSPPHRWPEHAVYWKVRRSGSLFFSVLKASRKYPETALHGTCSLLQNTLCKCFSSAQTDCSSYHRNPAEYGGPVHLRHHLHNIYNFPPEMPGIRYP